MNIKSDDVELHCETELFDHATKTDTMKENRSSYSQSVFDKIFHRSKQSKTSTALPLTVNDISEDDLNKMIINLSSSCSSSANVDSNQYEKHSKHRSYTENYDLRKDRMLQIRNVSQFKNISDEMKPPAKSKLVLENIKKMIKNQNIQQQQQQSNPPQQNDFDEL